ncbi:MAG: uroporphyrinogen decarboxylase family protein [Planctomycetota bacterium]
MSTSEMSRRERVMCALSGGKPDVVPFAEQFVAGNIPQQLLGLPDGQPYRWCDLAEALGNDVVKYSVLPQMYYEQHEGGIGPGLIKSRDDLAMVDLSLDDSWIDDAKTFLKEQRGERAAALGTRLGISPVLLSMGIDNFSMALFDDPGLIEELLDRYVERAKRVVSVGCEIGFDLVWCFDDFAYKTGPMFSPDTFREVFVPKLKIATDEISLPWIFHSDGNLYSVLDDLLSLGMSALHPIEPEAMDLKEFKDHVEGKICIIGNVSVDLLARGTPEEVREAVRDCMERGAPGGGYMISSGNSIPGYASMENVRAMIDAIEEFRYNSY